MKLTIFVLLFLCLFVAGIKYSPTSIPFSHDASQVTGMLLGGVACEVNQPMTVDVSCTDPDGDPLTIVTTGATGMTTIKQNDHWRLQWTPDKVGLYYIVLEAEDIPGAGKTPKKRYATVVINVLANNNAPVFEPFTDATSKTPQKRYQEFKKKNTYIMGVINRGEI